MDTDLNSLITRASCIDDQGGEHFEELLRDINVLIDQSKTRENKLNKEHDVNIKKLAKNKKRKDEIISNKELLKDLCEPEYDEEYQEVLEHIMILQDLIQQNQPPKEIEELILSETASIQNEQEHLARLYDTVMLKKEMMIDSCLRYDYNDPRLDYYKGIFSIFFKIHNMEYIKGTIINCARGFTDYSNSTLYRYISLSKGEIRYEYASRRFIKQLFCMVSYAELITDSDRKKYYKILLSNPFAKKFIEDYCQRNIS